MISDPGVLAVKEAEALGLYFALSWVQSLNLKKVIFEMDAKLIVNALVSCMNDVMEFGSLIHDYKSTLFS
ncbi:hypothetical protein PTKIN_Ptkin04bG0141900 [Pterospermum kingtungense]